MEDVVLHQLQGTGIDGHPAFLVAFAEDLEHLLLGVDVGEFEVDQF